MILDQPLVVKNKERVKRTLGIIVPDSYYSRTEEKDLPVDLSIVTQSRYENELSIVLPILECIFGILYKMYFLEYHIATHLDLTVCIASTYTVLSKETRNKKGGAAHVGWSTPHIMIIIRSHYQLRQVVSQSHLGPFMIK